MTALDFTTGGVHWQVSSPEAEEIRRLCEALFESGCLDLESWVTSGKAVEVKNAPHRTIHRIHLPHLDVHLKHCRPVSVRDHLRQWVRPSKARLEYRQALAVAARGVPTLVPLAVGEEVGKSGGGSSYLITFTVADALPLQAFLEHQFPLLSGARQRRVRHDLARALGRFLACMHQAGISHPDLHPGNLLVHFDVDNQPMLYLIDLHAVQLGAPRNWSASRESLVMINRWFTLRTGRTDRLRAWRAYAQARWRKAEANGCPGGSLSEELAWRGVGCEVEQRTWRSNLAFWRNADQRCLGGNRRYCRFRARSLAGYRVSDLSAETLAPLLADPDGMLGTQANLLKESRTSTVVERDLPGYQGRQPVIYKRFKLTRWSSLFTGLLRPTQALRSYQMGHGLRLRGLPTPRPLAVWQRFHKGLPGEGYLLTEKLPDAQDLRTYLHSLATLEFRTQRRAQHALIEQLARLLRQLHTCQLEHRDLKATNLLVSPASWTVSARGVEQGPVVPGSAYVWFIDLVGVRSHRRLSFGRRVQNLARLHASFREHPAVTRTDKLRFLRTYLCWALQGRFEWKRWWRAIARATRAKVDQNARNGRPLN